jgi:hypothetical protein
MDNNHNALYKYSIWFYIAHLLTNQVNRPVRVAQKDLMCTPGTSPLFHNMPEYASNTASELPMVWREW